MSYDTWKLATPEYCEPIEEDDVDPNACLQRFLDALDDGDSHEAYDAHQDLTLWLKGGGSQPYWSEEGRKAFSEFTRLPRFTSMGSYPLLYSDGGAWFCHCCASLAGLAETDADVHYEGEPYVCDRCGEDVESAYGFDEASVN